MDASTAPWSSLVELLRERAREQAHDTAFVYLKDGEVEEASLTYAELEARARAIAAHLQKRAQPGERALLLFPAGLDYVCAFFGCLFAGVIAVPIYPPQSQRSRVGRLQSVIADSGASWLLAGSEILASLQADPGFEPLLAGLHSMATDSLGQELASRWQAPDVGPSTVAFLQYTSGSTGTAKGVVVSHGNLLSNEALIREGFANQSSDVVVGWLPLYHDMGLVGNVLQPIYLGAKAVLMSPMAFLQKPIRWLEAISKYRGTVSGGPNFAYELCAERVTGEQLPGLDLSSWRVAFNGSEPIRATTLERFAAAFAGAGFSEAAFFPCYGLAESTLFVSGAEPSAAPVCLDVDPAALQRHVVTQPAAEARRRLVGSGRADLSRVCIVAPAEGRRCAADEVGEIWIRGASVAQGYWHRPQTTTEMFQAHTSDGAGPFLRTGDYGFVRDGELFVTGRLKELIIIRGRNHYPQDIEQTVQASHPALTIGAGAAFSVDVDGEERLVVVQEVQRTHLRRLDFAAVLRAVRMAVSEQHELQLHALALIKPMRLPKTSSGKIKRRETRSLYLDSQLDRLDQPVPAPPAVVPPTVAATPVTLPDRGALSALPATERVALLQAFLQHLLADVLRVPIASVDLDEALTAQGLDSLAAIQLQHRLDSDAGLDCPLELLLAGPSPRELAGRLAEATLQPLVAAVPPSGSERGPLSWNQESMWFLQSMAPQSSTYNLAVPLRMRSLLSRPRLEQAWALLAQRHPMLHTHFDASGDVLCQQIDAAAAPVIDWVDAEAWSDERLQHTMAEAARRSLLRDGAAPVQVQVYRRGPSDHTLLLLAHHIAVDLQTLVLLLRQLGDIYTAMDGGITPPPAPVAHTTIDFALWQRALVASEAGERQWHYWREQLAGELPVLTLPTDRPRPRLRDNAGAVVDFALDADLSDRLRTLARTQGVTLYMLLLAAYQLFLHKYNGDETVCVGSPVAGRSCTAFDSLAGYCVNTVVLRADLSGNPRFDELLAQVRERVLGALANQDLPFACLVERLVPQRDPAVTPLFQTLFSLQQTPELPAASAFVLGEPGARVELGALTVESVELPPQTCQFDLSLFVTEGAAGLRARFEYAASLFDTARIEGMAEHFRQLLEGIVATPHASLSQLPLLSRPQALGLLRQCNAPCESPEPESLVQMVARQASASPDVAALICGEQRLDYAGLERASASLADALRTRGIGPGDRIGLCLPRDTRAFVSLLAVLKTGAAYVPLDPAYPAARLGTITALARLRLVLVAAAGTAPAGDVPVLRLDPDGTPVDIAGEKDADIVAAMHDRSVAARWNDPALPVYLIYTSGSTGTPKGVAMNQGTLVNLLRWQQRAMPLASGARVSQFASINFDVSFQEIFSTWIAGGTLVVATDEQRHDPEALLQLLHQQQVQRAFLPVVVLQQVAQQALTCGQLPGALHQVICAGEALLLNAVVRRFFQALPGAQLYNHYGPTESHVVTNHCLQGDPGQWPAAPPIGRPIDNASIYLLDGYGHPVPFGAAGELCVAGASLADGYFDRGDLTAERFVPDSFVGGGAARMYRTGDLGRYLPDGSIEYLGRRDSQIQLRGFRIELGEIETQLCAIEGVGEAIVVLREDASGAPYLAGYLVPSAGVTADLTAWRSTLRERLPDYMVPAQLVQLDALPLTANGKVDTRALPAPDGSHTTAGYVAPRGATEQRVAQLWSAALGVDQVGRNDHFFEHGGHSLLATRLVARLRAAFAVQLPVSALFEAPTVAGLAARIDAAPAAAAPPLLPVSRAQALPLSHAQQRLWFIEQMEGASATYNMPAAFRLEGRLDLAALRGALQQIVRRHEVLRTCFTQADQQPVQQVDESVVLHVPVLDVAEGDVTERLREHAQAPFQLREAPLFRATVLRLAPEQHVLLVNMHHIVCDGWSIGVLVRELTELYTAAIEQREATLAPLAVQYGDYAHWQRRWVDAMAASQLAYWRDQLDGLPPLLELPGDRPRPPVQSYHGGLHRFVLPRSLGDALARFSQEHGATVFMTLMAAFQVLLARHSGQTDIAVGTPVANRDRPELENLIGFFVNTVILRGRLDRAGSFLQLLAQVRDATIAAQRHQDVPFEQLVEELKPTRSLSHAPLFQVMFLQHDGALDGLRLPGLTLRGEDQGHTIARFDLALNVEQRRDGLHAWFDYAADLFDAERIARLATHYQQLLVSVLQDATAHWSRLPMLAADEVAAQVAPQRTLAAALEPTLCVPRLFEAQVDRDPEALAAVFEDQSLRYGELEQRSNRLAHHLLAQGVRADDHIGVWMERSPELLVAIMAIWKAGAVYVPLDPGYPRERLDYIVEDAGISLILTHSSLGEALQAPAARALCVDRLAADLATSPTTRPVSSSHGLQPAYVIYTSGSTGKPKGVQVLQTGLCELLLGLRNRFELGPRDSMPSLASHAFGISFVELLLPLVVGGHTRILGREAVLDTERLACELARVTRAHLVPSLMRRVLDHLAEVASVPDYARLRHVFVGGDAVAPLLLAEMAKRFPAAEVVEFYGQTETTILSCHAPQGCPAHAGNVIGKRLPHAQAYVLDEDLQLLAQGRVGEIHVGGHGVARGYLGRPGQTAERFVPDPFGTTAGGRLYRSGDLGRLLADGSIEYVGRSDFQVNIRGFRIELGEIEAVLRAEPEVSGAIVTAGEDERGERRLLAYVVPEIGQDVSIPALRNRLRTRLPDYMMPAQFVLLDAFPLNANGKLDRRALPAPDPAALAGDYVAPRDELEQELADLWAGVLGLSRVGIHDNFFDLGGHSLLAAQAMARARQQLDTEISVQDFFEAQTVAEFAAKVRAVRHNQALLAQLTAGGEDDSDEFEDYVI